MASSDESKKDSLYLIAAFIDDLINHEVRYQVKTIKNLPQFALVLGAEETRNEFIPFLSDLIYAEDEVKLALIKELDSFGPYIGGPEYLYCLLLPFEKLAAAEKKDVRLKVVDSLNKICLNLSPADLLHHYLPLIKRLAADESCQSRASVCGLLDTCYFKTTPLLRADLRTLYQNLCKDSSAVVRRAALEKLVDFSNTVEIEFRKTDLVPVWEKFLKDKESSIRRLAVDSYSSLSTILPFGNRHFLMSNQCLIIPKKRLLEEKSEDLMKIRRNRLQYTSILDEMMTAIV